MRLYFVRWALSHYNWCPYKKQTFVHINTHIGRMPCEGEDKSQGDASTSQKLPATHQKLGEKQLILTHNPQIEPTLLML